MSTTRSSTSRPAAESRARACLNRLPEPVDRRPPGYFPMPCQSASKHRTGRCSSTRPHAHPWSTSDRFFGATTPSWPRFPCGRFGSSSRRTRGPRRLPGRRSSSHEIGPLLGVAGGAERRVEWHALGHRYGHLSPLVAASAWSRLGVEQGEQEGAQGSARSQPPWLDRSATTPANKEPRAGPASGPTTTGPA